LRFGLADPCVHSRIAPNLVLTSTRALAFTTGADSILLPDHLISVIPRSIYTAKYVVIKRLVPSLDACYEPWTVLGLLAARNRLGRLRLGTGCTDTARRNPAVTAQAAATLHQLSKGRAILGIGAGEGMNQSPYGVPADQRVAMFEEAVATIRALWDSGGQPVSRDSPFFPLRDAVMSIPPYRGTWPELWIGAHGPRMRRIAARYADTWFPGVTMDASEYGEHLAGIRDAAADAGRDPHAIGAAKYFFVVTARSADVVEEILQAPVVKSYALCAPSEYWARHGAEHPLGPGFAGVQDLLPQTMDEQTALNYVRQVPASLIRNFVLAGTPSEILDQLAEWRDHGMTYPVLLNMGLLQPSLPVGLLSNVAYTQLLRGIRKLSPGRPRGTSQGIGRQPLIEGLPAPRARSGG
jgi:phthiodiolone/phenolphthiodiolone dimycocerosates ketoreductase